MTSDSAPPPPPGPPQGPPASSDVPPAPAAADATPPPPPGSNESGLTRALTAAGPRGAAEWRHWGLGEVVLGLLLSQVITALVAGVAFGVGGYDNSEEFPMWLVGVVTFPLQLTLLVVAVGAARSRGGGALRDFVTTINWRDAPQGIAAGLAAQFLLVPAVTLPVLWLLDRDIDEVSESARELTERATTPIGVIVLVLTVGVLAPLAEEVFFRGLVFGSYRKRRNLPWVESLSGGRIDTSSPRWNTRVAIVLSGVIFGAIHFQPILLPALAAVGMLFAYMYERSGRIGLAIWAHLGFNMTTLINLLVFQ